MHDIEPHFKWRDWYTAEEDSRSPFYGREYSEFEFSNTVYNYLIHPQWDEFDSKTLYLKILFADYDEQYAIIELLGEWNDAIENDIQTLKRNVLEPLMDEGIYKFILIGEQVLNFHNDIDDYYEEWYQELSDHNGWVVGINFLPHVVRDFEQARIHQYILFEESDNWRTLKPEFIFKEFDQRMQRLLG
ncbi:MAG: hypothetical protein ACR2IL_10320 [Chitinophagaceae bacterium]